MSPFIRPELFFDSAGNGARLNDRSLRPSLIVNGIECSFSAPVIADISGARCFTVFLAFYDRAVSPWTTTLRVMKIIAVKRYDISLITTITLFVKQLIRQISHKRENRYAVPIIHHASGIHTLLSLVQRLKRRQMLLCMVQDLRSIQIKSRYS